jgi:hypothetical protein
MSANTFGVAAVSRIPPHPRWHVVRIAPPSLNGFNGSGMEEKPRVELKRSLLMCSWDICT